MSATRKASEILVVEADETVLETVGTILRREGYELLCAKTGSTALDFAVEHASLLVILDLRLPDVSGLDVCRSLRDWYGGPILVLSELGDPDVIAVRWSRFLLCLGGLL